MRDDRNTACWNRWKPTTTRVCRRKRPQAWRHGTSCLGKRPRFSSNGYSRSGGGNERKTQEIALLIALRKTAGWTSAAWRSFCVVRRRHSGRNYATGEIFLDPPLRNGKSATDTLTGNMRAKLARAKAAQADARLPPTWKPCLPPCRRTSRAVDIGIKFGSTWIPRRRSSPDSGTPARRQGNAGDNLSVRARTWLCENQHLGHGPERQRMGHPGISGGKDSRILLINRPIKVEKETASMMSAAPPSWSLTRN